MWAARMSRRIGSILISRSPACVFERPMKRRPLARSTSRQSRLQSSCARGPAKTQRGDDRLAFGTARSADRGPARRPPRAAPRSARRVSRWTGGRCGSPAAAAACRPPAFSVSPKRLYSSATESTHCRKSIVLLIEPGESGRRTRWPCSFRCGRAALDRPRARFGLLHLERPVVVDRLDVDLDQRPIAEEGQQVPERPHLVVVLVFSATWPLRSATRRRANGPKSGASLRSSSSRAAPRCSSRRHPEAAAHVGEDVLPAPPRRAPSPSRRARSRASGIGARRRPGSEVRSHGRSSRSAPAPALVLPAITRRTFGWGSHRHGGSKSRDPHAAIRTDGARSGRLPIRKSHPARAAYSCNHRSGCLRLSPRWRAFVDSCSLSPLPTSLPSSPSGGGRRVGGEMTWRG